MVKTKIVAKKKQAPKPKEKANKKVIEDNIVESRVTNEYRAKGDWWDDILSGETCRTGNLDKVIAALGRARDSRKGLNIQAIPERADQYFWYITLIMTEEDAIPPSKKGKKK